MSFLAVSEGAGDTEGDLVQCCGILPAGQA